MALAPDPLAPIARALWLTRAGLVGERLLISLWLPGSMALLGGAAWAFGLFALLPESLAMWALLAWALGVFGLALKGLWSFRWPSQGEALARLDRSLPGRPLSALADQPLIGRGDPLAEALWQAHLARMAVVASAARPVPPAPDLARRDRYGLRLLALQAAVLAVLFAEPVRLERLPGLPQPAGAAVGPAWEAWITPPVYTGRPTLYLNEIDRPAFDVPQGARVMLRLYGAVPWSQSLGGRPEADASGQQISFTIVHSGRLSLGSRHWELTVLPDHPPEIDFAGPLIRGRGGVLTQPFRARDDYGVVTAEVEITLDLPRVRRTHGLRLEPEPREPLVLDLPMPVSGRRTEIHETLREDLAQHPWAHLPVVLRLRATDAAEQSGESTPRASELPARRFFEPAARAIAELRRDLLWNRDNAQRAALLLRAMLYRSEGAFRASAAPEMIRAVIQTLEGRLAAGTWDGAARDEVAAALWQIALTLEEGELANARDRLRRAQERLQQAMRDGASPEEVAELMDELREALSHYLRMLAEQAEGQRGLGADERDRGQNERLEITGRQLQELLNEIQRLMEEGRMDEAAALMAELSVLLENLRVERGAGGEPMEGMEPLEGLADTLSDQQRLADETFRRLQEDFRRGQGGDPLRNDPSQGGTAGTEDGSERAPSFDELARRQDALRERLREQQLQPFLGEDSEEGDRGLEALDDAERAMGEASRRLREGDARGALEQQAQAMERLREGLRALSEARQLERSARGDPGQAEAGQGARDPLGREAGSARLGSERSMGLPTEDPRARARDLLDEIRRRLAERERPQAERDYLGRLLERF